MALANGKFCPTPLPSFLYNSSLLFWRVDRQELAHVCYGYKYKYRDYLCRVA